MFEASQWHPVAHPADVTSRPVPVQLLGQDVVLWRDDSGAVRVANVTMRISDVMGRVIWMKSVKPTEAGGRALEIGITLAGILTAVSEPESVAEFVRGDLGEGLAADARLRRDVVLNGEVRFGDGVRGVRFLRMRCVGGER